MKYIFAIIVAVSILSCKQKNAVKHHISSFTDTTFSHSSAIDMHAVNSRQIQNLSTFGQVWGFIKYYHPNVAKGNVNMDAELFRIMPQVIKANSNDELSRALEQWVDDLGAIDECNDCEIPKTGKVKLTPNYGHLFDNSILSRALTKKLLVIRDNNSVTANYYIGMEFANNPKFTNEKAYADMRYPDAGYRILCLFRYWNMINYFFPYRHLIGEDWNTVLPQFIPEFVADENAQAYTLTTLKLISRVNDSHAYINSDQPEMRRYFGDHMMPLKCQFVENQLVVLGFFGYYNGAKDGIKKGDVITAINGVQVKALIKKYLHISAASNYPTQLRNMIFRYLLCSNNAKVKLQIIRDNKTLVAEATALPIKKELIVAYFNSTKDIPGYKLIDSAIGYVYPARYHNSSLDTIKNLFRHTKGIIVDMRCYPSDFMPFTFGAYIKTNKLPFVKFTIGNVHKPGLFTFIDYSAITPDTNEVFGGKVVVIVNQDSQSQAEYTTMAFQSSPNVTVIGGQTAGADGNVSQIILPGGIETMISGIGVYYPDGTETQRRGVKIDVKIKPTIAGIRAGRDELLEQAKKIIMN